ncbi:hypothetical protein HYV58_02065 [Candidatus Peregrinibacteria bacterium]|nr:hypothetical protein [Candidatus Peregrinibacteria bacterium]
MKFSFIRYGWRCVLGGEIAYSICLLGGFLPLRGERAVELHHLLFETMPGFTWISLGSFVLGALYVFVFAWIFAAYMVWMLNSSMVHAPRSAAE